MKIILLILVLFTISSCGTSQKLGNNKSDIELLKELAFCTCMNEGMKLYFQQDTLDASIQQVDAELETKKLPQRTLCRP
ncbi:MAG: hypothetical protein PHD73_08625 [Sediminibacterium sp.]|nr:hypothetical protein [Sediminibacterium sp.]